MNKFCFFVKATFCITTALAHPTAGHFRANRCTSLWRTKLFGRAVAFYYVENFRWCWRYNFRYTKRTEDFVDFITNLSIKYRIKIRWVLVHSRIPGCHLKWARFIFYLNVSCVGGKFKRNRADFLAFKVFWYHE